MGCGVLQAGTKESTAHEVELGQTEGPVLKALIEFMYGRLSDVPSGILLPLFVAADAHQVCFPALQVSCMVNGMSSV